MRKLILSMLCLLALAACKGKQPTTVEFDDEPKGETKAEVKDELKNAFVGKWQEEDAGESPLCFELTTDDDGRLEVAMFGYYAANSEYDAEASMQDGYLVIEAKGPQGTIELSLEPTDDSRLEGGIGLTDSNGEQADGIITMKRGWPE